METSLSITKRFIRKIDICSDEECWLWMASKFVSGYGQFRLNGRLVRAHRVAYFLRHGNLPLYDNKGESLFVCHRCDIKLCCNPSHLFLGTTQDNTEDSVLKNRRADMTGMKNPSACLSERQVWEIRLMLAKGITQKRIAECYNVVQTTITKISTGKSWSHLKGGDKTVNTTNH